MQVHARPAFLALTGLCIHGGMAALEVERGRCEAIAKLHLPAAKIVGSCLPSQTRHQVLHQLDSCGRVRSLMTLFGAGHAMPV